jgi:hypothetical protein
VTGRIIDADMDQRANIDRLTAQVETLKREVDQYEAQLQLERREGRELGLMYAGSNERLQESLTAVEQERDDFKRIVEVWRKRHGGAEDRVRVLEGALREVIRWGDKLSWSIMSDACGWIYGIAKDALTPAPPVASHTLDCNEGMIYGDSCSCAQPDGPPICPVHHPDCAPRTAPPAETPAPTCRNPMCVEAGDCPGHDDAPVARDASADARIDPVQGICINPEDCCSVQDERDRLRAELAAAKKRADEFAGVIIKAAELNASKDRELAAANEEVARLHASMKLIRDAAKQALDDRDTTTTKLGRAVAEIQRALDANDIVCTTSCNEVIGHTASCSKGRMRAILADADGTQAAEALREMEAVYQAARVVEPDGYGKIRALLAAVAAVDARRGQGAK